MKKWLIFDFGQVLVKYFPEDITRFYLKNEDSVKKIAPVLFDRLYWDRLDAGTIEDEELLSLVKERLPIELHRDAETVYRGWIDALPEIPGMRELAIRLKADYSLELGLLSNISRGFAEREADVPILSLFSVKVYSATAGATKPSGEIFKILCNRCNADPSELVFVDDSEKNVRGAQDFGIDAVLFDGDVSSLEKKLRTIFEKQ